MLVVSRFAQEKIWIGEDICITIVSLDKGKVRIGIEAPKNVDIHREEIRPSKEERDQRANASKQTKS